MEQLIKDFNEITGWGEHESYYFIRWLQDNTYPQLNKKTKINRTIKKQVSIPTETGNEVLVFQDMPLPINISAVRFVNLSLARLSVFNHEFYAYLGYDAEMDVLFVLDDSCKWVETTSSHRFSELMKNILKPQSYYDIRPIHSPQNSPDSYLAGMKQWILKKGIRFEWQRLYIYEWERRHNETSAT